MIPRVGNEFQAPTPAIENLKIPSDLSELVRKGQKAKKKASAQSGLTVLKKKVLVCHTIIFDNFDFFYLVIQGGLNITTISG